MITLRHKELFPGGVTLLLSLRGSIKDGWYGKHRHDGQHFRSTLVFSCRDEHFGQRRLHGKVGHFAASRREITDVVECSEDPELVHRVEDILLRWRIHKVELQEVFYTEGFEQQNSIRQIRSLNFRDIAGIQLVDIR